MCCFCKKMISGGKLKRHIRTHKKTHEEVAAILKKPVQDQNKWFDKKRSEGMYLYNMSHLHIDDCKLMRERKPKKPDQLRMCLGCKRFFSNRTFYKHKEKCADNSEPVKTQTLQPLNIHKDSDFVLDILNKFRDGNVGSFIRENKVIQTIGYKHYLSRKAESSKIVEVKKEVMMEMRELARLFLSFQSLAEIEVTFEDMYKREHLSTLKEAMNKLCESEQGEKHGLKVNLNSIFQRSIKILKGYYSQSCLDSQVKQLKLFKEAYKFSQPEIIGSARYHTEKNSLKKARLPKNLPIKEDIMTLKRYISAEIEHTVNNFSLTYYTWLRSLVVARLTLYNARRGEEGSRLLVGEWVDAMNETWVPKENIEQVQDDAEKFLVGQFKLAYMAGKGRNYVPILIPVDLIEAIKLLNLNRKAFGIVKSNIFLFATKSSKSHCSGWHAVAAVCDATGVSVNATKNRHLASTVYAGLEMTEAHRRIFFDHLGHHENINKENYQCPPGLDEIRVMGKFLNALEGKFLFCSNLVSTCTSFVCPC